MLEPPKENLLAQPVKARCAYCKAEFVLGKKVTRCPSCGRIAVMPGHFGEDKSEKRKRHLRRSMLAKSGAGDSAGMAFQEILSARRFSRVALVVGAVAIIGALVFDTPAPIPYVPPTLEQTCRRELSIVWVALQRFERDCGRYPTTEEGLVALVRKPPNLPDWDGNYVTLIRPDPWLHPYVYRCQDGMITLLSLGADGKENTADDIPVPRISSEQLAPYLEKDELGWVTPEPKPRSTNGKEKTF